MDLYSRRRLTRVLLVIVVLVLAVLCAEVAYVISVDRRSDAGADSSPGQVDWQEVPDNDSHARYRVPPDFEVADSLQRRTFGQQLPGGADLIVLRSTALLKDLDCDQDPLALNAIAGFVDHPVDAELPSATQVAREVATQALAHRDGFHPTLPEPSVRRLELPHGGRATMAVLSAQVSQPYPCSPPALRFTVVEYEVRDEPVHFLLAGDVGDQRELPAEVERQILTSLGTAS